MIECGEFIKQEYFEILKTITDFDGRLFLIKGWGVTFSLATLAIAFQKRSVSKPLHGLFFVATLSAFSFWMLESIVKGEQMRYYPRMRHIEKVCSDSAKSKNPPEPPSPLIDWSWDKATDQFNNGIIPDESQIEERNEFSEYKSRFFKLHVLFPNFIIFIVGLYFAIPYKLNREKFRRFGKTSSDSDKSKETNDGESISAKSSEIKEKNRRK